MIRQFLAFFVCVAALYSQLHAKTYELIEDKSQLKTLTPAMSDVQTSKIRLQNGLEALIISDPGAEQSAAALAVEAGSWDDPLEYPGMAHFLEHMLFMGTKAYPKEDEFMPYVKECGGKVNAYTASDRTVYMFSANNAGFQGALDRFSHFFIDPLFNTASIERELHAVDQEHAKNLENDGWRQYMIFKETGNQNHPNAKFSTGNADTLGGIPRQAMIDWHEKHYSSDRMHLIVVSSMPIDELITLTVNSFSPVPQRETSKQAIFESLTSDTQKGHLIYIKPIKDLRILSLTWELPENLSADQEAKVGELLCYTLKSGSKNSLLGLLKREHLAEEINVSQEQLGKTSRIFSIDIALTDKGLQDVNTVSKYCFEALARLKKTNIPRYIFDEVEKIKTTEFEYRSRIDSFYLVMTAADAMLREDLETFPKKTLIPTHYDPQLIGKYLDYLTPENCLFFVIADPGKVGIETTRKEKWMGAEYAVLPVGNKTMYELANATINPQIGLPPPNPYIPKNLQLLHTGSSTSKTEPVAIENDSFGKVYMLEDSKYLVPFVSHRFRIKSPLIDTSTKAQVLCDLYIRALENQLTPTFTAAEAAGAKINLSHSNLSMKVSIDAYSDGSEKLTEEIMGSLKKIRASKEEFHLFKRSLASQYENQEKELLFLQVQRLLGNLIFNDSHTAEEKLPALHSITYEEFSEFSQNVFKKAYLEGLLYGNIAKPQSTQLLTTIKNAMKSEEYPVKDHHEKSILMLSNKGGPYMVTERTGMQGNAAILMIEQGPYSFERRATQQVLGIYLQNAFFDTLRTKQQVAYIAKAWDKTEEHQLLQCFAVQSSTHLPSELIGRFELFLENFIKQYSTEFPIERFEKVREMAIATVSMPPENLMGNADRLFTLGFDYNGDFDFVEKRIDALKKINYDEVRLAAERCLSRKNSRRLAVLLEGVTPPERDFRYETVSKEDLIRDGRFVTKRETVITPMDPESVIR